MINSNAWGLGPWASREEFGRIGRLVFFLAGIALHRRFSGSWLGLGWSLLNPLSYILILAFAFAVILNVQIEGYVIYLAAGLLPWNFISTSLTVSAASITSRKEVINSTALPIWVFIVGDIACEAIVFLISLSVLALYASFRQPLVIPMLVFMPLTLIPLAMFVVGAGIVLAHLSVWFRDIPHLLAILLSLMFWLMPIVYHWSMIPERFSFIVKYNPLAVLISGTQVILHGGEPPSFLLLACQYAIGATALVIAISLVRRVGRGVVYDL